MRSLSFVDSNFLNNRQISPISPYLFGPGRSAGLYSAWAGNAAGENVHVFLGIPFGESTAGDNRWQLPPPKARVSGVIDVSNF